MKSKTILITVLVVVQLILLVGLTSAMSITSVKSVPENIAPGETAKVSLEIENNLGEDLENVVVGLDLTSVPFAPYQSSSEKTIEEFDDGDKETINFNLMALSDSDAGTYKIPVKISYNLENGSEEKTSHISLTISSKPELKISYEGNLIKGRENEFDIKIINSGLGGAKLLSIELIEVSGIRLTSIKNFYIGDIDSGDFDIASFKMFINENAGSSIILPIILVYRDATNKEYSDTSGLMLKTYSVNEAISLGIIQKSNTITYVLVIIGLIVIYFVYRGFKKRKRRRLAEGR